MVDGYYALLASIHQDLSVDQAVELECGTDGRPKKRGRKTKFDLPLCEVLELKLTGMSYTELGKLYQVNPNTLQTQLLRYRKVVGK